MQSQWRFDNLAESHYSSEKLFTKEEVSEVILIHMSTKTITLLVNILPIDAEKS